MVPYTDLDSVLLSSSVEAADGEASETYGEELNYMVSGWELGSTFLPDRSPGRGHCSLDEPSQSHQVGTIYETPSTWLTVFSLPWWFPEALSHPTFFGRWVDWGGASFFRWRFHKNGLFWPMLQIFPSCLNHAASSFSEPCTSHEVAPGPALAAAAILSSQLGLAWAPPSPEQVAAICRSFCCLCCVTPDRTQVLADIECANSNLGSTTVGRFIQPTLLVGTPWVSSLGEWGGWAIDPYRVPATLGHSTKPGRHISST